MSSTAKAKTAKLSQCLSVISVMPLIASYSPHPPRFLHSHTGQPTNSNKCPHRQHRVGEEGETSISETQLRDKIGRVVSTGLPAAALSNK